MPKRLSSFFVGIIIFFINTCLGGCHAGLNPAMSIAPRIVNAAIRGSFDADGCFAYLAGPVMGGLLGGVGFTLLTGRGYGLYGELHAQASALFQNTAGRVRNPEEPKTNIL